jgi:hypothetical protein
MAYGIPETGQEWMRQVEKRLMTQERRGPNLPGTFVPVPSQADQDSLVAWYQPTPVKPLLIDRTDTTTRPDLRYTKDGILWWSFSAGMTRLPAPYIYPTLQNGWVNYGGGHAPAQFIKLSSGVVLIHGLIRTGTATAGTLLFTLPEGYRPATKLTFPVATNDRIGRVSVLTDGRVLVDNVSNAWLSLAGIVFPTEALTWTQPTLINGFVDYATVDSSWPTFAWAQDALGRVWFRGLLSRNGATTPGDTAMFVLPAEARPAWQLHFAGIGTGEAFASLDVMPTGEVRAKTGAPTASWLCLNGMRWVGAATIPEAGYTPLALINGWASYGTGFPVAAYTILADGMAISHGLIKNGTVPSNYAALPAGSRSGDGVQIFPANANNTYGRHDINLAALTVQGGSNLWFSIDGPYWVPDS